MKAIVRSKSETDFFHEKESLDIVHGNLKKFKNSKFILGKNKVGRRDVKMGCVKGVGLNINALKKETLEQKLQQHSTNTKTLTRNNTKSNLLNIAKEEMQKSVKFENILNTQSEKTNDVDKIEEIFKNYLKMILKFKLEFDKVYFKRNIDKQKMHINLILETILTQIQKFKQKYIIITGYKNEIMFSPSGDVETSFSGGIVSDISNSNTSPYNICVLPPNPNENLIENLEKFERILEILIKIQPEELFREVKSIILNEFDQTTNEIQAYLDRNKNESNSKFFTSMSQTILFVLSSISFKLDYYSITINSLVEKLNRFFVDFVESTANSENPKEFLKSLDLVQKFVKIKKIFMKEFTEKNVKNEKMNTSSPFTTNASSVQMAKKMSVTSVKTKGSNLNIMQGGDLNVSTQNFDESSTFAFSQFSFNKFCSFGRYFFNNLLPLLDLNIQTGGKNNNFNLNSYSDIKQSKINKEIYQMYKVKFKSGKEYLLWKNYLNDLVHKNNDLGKTAQTYQVLDKFFKLYFTSKLAKWKYASITPSGDKKNEICRICECSFSIADFVLHVFYCKDQRVYYQQLHELKMQLSKSVDSLKKYREKLLGEKTNFKDFFFSPKSEFNQKFRMHLLDKTPKLHALSKFGGKNPHQAPHEVAKPDTKSEMEFLDSLIQTISKERDLIPDYYERFPHKISHLLSIVHFTVYIFCQNKNCISYSSELNQIFAVLFITLMKKLIVIENILTLFENREKAKIKLKNQIMMKKSNTNIMEGIFNSTANTGISGSGYNIINNYASNGSSTSLLQVGETIQSRMEAKNRSLKQFCKKVDDAKLKLSFRSHTSTPKNFAFLKHSNSLNVRDNNTKMNGLNNFPGLKIDTNSSNNNNSGIFGPSTNTPNSTNNFNAAYARISPRANQIKAVSNELKFCMNGFNSNRGGDSENSFKINSSDIDQRRGSNFDSPVIISQDFSRNYSHQGDSSNFNSPLNLVNSPFSSNTHNTDGENHYPTQIHQQVPMSTKKSLFEKAKMYKNSENSSPISPRRKSNLSTNKDKEITNSNFNDSSIDSEVSQLGNERNSNPPSIYLKTPMIDNNIDENINELDEIDSQFDEMIELMDEIQISEPNQEDDMFNFGDDIAIVNNSEKDQDDKEDMVVNNLNRSSYNSNYKGYMNNPIKISDFKFMSEIASGGYGRVDIYKKITTGDLYAIKTVNIKKMKAKNISGLLKKETLALNEIFHDFVVKCYYIFSDKQSYYYAMEYMPGGDLLSLLNAYELPFDTVQLIMAETILALNYIHTKDIIHRDIKPENIIISNEGHFKLTDFGLSETGFNQNKYVITNPDNLGRVDTMEDDFINPDKLLGTENYMAPEVIKNESPLTQSVDYWAMGVLLFELFTNKMPFKKTDTVSTIFDNICNLNIQWEEFNKIVDDSESIYKDKSQLNHAKDLIFKFLNPCPIKRWNSNNIEEIKAHPFFNNLDWKNVKSIKDPLVSKHVALRIKKLKTTKPAAQMIPKSSNDKIDVDNISFANENSIINNPSNNHNDYFERVDNLFIKNQEIIRSNIKLKKFELEFEDQKFTDFMADLD